MSSDTIVDSFDPDADRNERSSALEKFARVGENKSGGSAVIPAQAFNDRIVGAQEVAVHRDTSRVLAELKTLAAAAGQDWYYRYPVQNRKENRHDWIEGPSIKLANDLARLYGNCDVDTRVTDIGDQWMIYARFTDYETGFSMTRPFQQRKNASKMGGVDDARRLDIALQIGVSKAIRNVVVNALQTFSDFAFEEAKNGLVDKIGQNLERYRARILEGLSNQKIDVKRVELVIGRTTKDWLAPDMARIIAMMKAIADGMATWDETFPPMQGGDGDSNSDKKPAPASLDTFAAGGAGDASKGETTAPTTVASTTSPPEATQQAPQDNTNKAGENTATKNAADEIAGTKTKSADKPAAASTKAPSKNPTDWTDAECAAHGRAAYAKGMTRRAAIPGELRGDDQEHRATIIEQAFDHAAATANGQKAFV